MAKSLSAEIGEAIRKIAGFGDLIKAERQMVLAYAAEPLVEEIKNRAPVGISVHKRYPYRKNAKKAAKGAGKPVATYSPGNLRRAFRLLKFSRSKDVFVGAKVAKKGQMGGTYKGGRADGYYAHMVEYGTRHSAAKPFVRPAIPAATPNVKRRLTEGFRKLGTAYVNKNKIV